MIESNYQKAVDLNHWKAVNNLAILYRKGAYNVNDKVDHPTSIVPNKERMLALYARMVQLKVPMGYYNWAVTIQRGQVKNAQKGDSASYMPLAAFYYQKAASHGSIQGFIQIINMFREDPKTYNFGYLPNPELSNIYKGLYVQLRKNPNLTFPNLMKEYPLPLHPTQGYDADHPDTRPQ